MPTYRLRHRYGTEPDREFQAGDDAEALELARTFADGSDYALRCGDRCVALLRHDARVLLVSGLVDFASGDRAALHAGPNCR